MSSERIIHRPQELFAPVDTASSDYSAQQALPSFPQPNSLTEQTASPESNTTISTLILHTNALLGIAFAAQSREQSPLQSKLEPFNIKVIRQARRTIWEQTGYIPPIAGGSPKRIDLPVDEIVTAYRNNTHVEDIANQYGVTATTIYRRLHEAGMRTHVYKPREKVDLNVEVSPDKDTARRRVEEIFSTKWDKKTDEGRAEYRKAIHELARIWKVHPDIKEEVDRSLYGEEE